MRRTHEQIIAYAARLVELRRKPKPLLAVRGTGMVALVVLSLKMLFDKQSVLESDKRSGGGLSGSEKAISRIAQTRDDILVFI